MDLNSIIETFFDLANYHSVVINPIDSGHINTTYSVELRTTNLQTEKYVLQCINTHVFKQPEDIMSNLGLIAAHLGESDYPKSISKAIANKAGEYLTYDAAGSPWRMLPYIDNSICFDKVQSPMQAYEAAKAFGEFYVYLWDLDCAKVKTAIPHFIDFELRLLQFDTALAHANKERKVQAKNEIDFILAHKDLPKRFIAMQKEGVLPLRLIHADPKISNVLFSTITFEPLAVIDLDTVMLGTLLYDYGDMVRSYTNNKSEDDANPNDVFNKIIYDAITDGFLFHLKDKLMPIELDNMAYSAQVIIYIQALRFLSDFLNGDKYYRIDYPEQNLNRTKNQIHLLQGLLSNK
jgi:aminoglycoside phosphotransferase (APT) family kinase protein